MAEGWMAIAEWIEWLKREKLAFEEIPNPENPKRIQIPKLAQLEMGEEPAQINSKKEFNHFLLLQL